AQGSTEAGWCALLLQSSRREPGRLERRALWRLVRLADLASTGPGGRVRRARALLPTRRIAARAAALAGKRLAVHLMPFRLIEPNACPKRGAHAFCMAATC